MGKKELLSSNYAKRISKEAHYLLAQSPIRVEFAR